VWVEIAQKSNAEVAQLKCRLFSAGLRKCEKEFITENHKWEQVIISSPPIPPTINHCSMITSNTNNLADEGLSNHWISSMCRYNHLKYHEHHNLHPSASSVATSFREIFCFHQHEQPWCKGFWYAGTHHQTQLILGDQCHTMAPLSHGKNLVPRLGGSQYQPEHVHKILQGIWSPDHPAHSKALYQLRYSTHWKTGTLYAYTRYMVFTLTFRMEITQKQIMW
jgi:hypothetical protein